MTDCRGMFLTQGFTRAASIYLLTVLHLGASDSVGVCMAVVTTVPCQSTGREFP